LRRAPLPRVLRGVLRRRLPRAARRLVGHAPARGHRHVPQLGPAAAPADLRWGEARVLTAPRVVVRSYLGPGEERALADDVLDGLTRPFKEIPPKHFYDARGAELFDRICELPEYYPTRAEAAILRARSEAVAARTGAAELVELGSGTAAKTRLLLAALA